MSELVRFGKNFLRSYEYKMAKILRVQRKVVLFIDSLADVAELADALDLGSSGESRAGSSPVIRIKNPL